MMALWLDVSVIFAFLGKCKLDCSILQNSRVTGWTRMSESSTAINCEKQTLNISELLPVIRVRIFDSGRVKQGRNNHQTTILDPETREIECSWGFEHGFRAAPCRDVPADRRDGEEAPGGRLVAGTSRGT